MSSSPGVAARGGRHRARTMCRRRAGRRWPTPPARRGATAVAAEGFLTAARLSPTQPDRAARLLAAGDATWVVGRVDEATEILGEALDASETPHGAGRGRDAPRPDRPLGAGSPRCPRPFPRRRGPRWSTTIRAWRRRLISQAAFTAVVSGDVHGALALAAPAFELAPADDLAATVQATVTLGYLESHAADPGGRRPARADHRDGRAVRRQRRFRRRRPARARGHVPHRDRALGRGGAVPGRRRAPLPAKRRDGDAGRCAPRSWPRSTGAPAIGSRRRTWRRTTSLDGATMPVNQAWASAFLAHLDAGAGRAESCRQRAASAVRGGGATGAGVVLVWAGHAMGLLEVGFGRWAEAAAPARPGRRAHRVAGTPPAGSGLVAGRSHRGARASGPSGRRRRGRSIVSTDERSAGSQRWPACVAARGRALLAGRPRGRPRGAGDLGRSWRRRSPSPFEAARSRLIRGERLLEAGSAAAAGDDLRDALDAFDRLGRPRSRSAPARCSASR